MVNMKKILIGLAGCVLATSIFAADQDQSADASQTQIAAASQTAPADQSQSASSDQTSVAAQDQSATPTSSAPADQAAAPADDSKQPAAGTTTMVKKQCHWKKRCSAGKCKRIKSCKVKRAVATPAKTA